MVSDIGTNTAYINYAKHFFDKDSLTNIDSSIHVGIN